MKSLNYKLSFLLLLMMFFSTNTFALIVTIDTDTFDSTTDGWSGTNITQDSSQLLIDRDDIASKTYTFSTIPNQTITFTLDAIEVSSWESSDVLRINVNGTEVISQTISDTDSLTFNVTLDSSGSSTITIQPDTNNNLEDVRIDNIIVTYDDPQTAPTITPETFTIYQDASIGTLIGSVIATPYATSFSIYSGDIDNLFTIDNSGNITVYAALDTNSTSSYDLNISATNTYGTGSDIITINLVEDIALSSDAINTRDFKNVPIIGKNSVTIFGSVLQIGNQILCKSDADFDKCEDPGTTDDTQNNYHTQYLARIDNNVTHSNTMAKLVMQADDEVIFARLYWSARIETATSTEIGNAKKIKIKGPASTSYTQLTSLNAKFNWHDSGANLGDGVFDYVASTDVTEYVKTNGAGEYYVGDISTTSGKTGTYASWQLIVVVKNTSRSLKNIAIYDGFYSIYSFDSDYPDSITVSASGFITPNGSKPFNANLFVYGGETDDGYGDSSSILKADGTTWVDLVDGQNDSNDVMNASVSSPDYTGGYRSNETGMANPNFRNVLGVDIDKLKINDENNTSLQTLSNSQTSTEIKLESSGDRYSLNMFAFETEVFTPEFCYDYSIKQDGSYLNIDRDAYPIAHLNSLISSSDLEITVYLKNLEADIAAEGVTIKSDVNSSKFTHSTNIYTSNINGTTLIDRGTPESTEPLCNYDINGDNSTTNSGCSDGHNIRKGMGTLVNGDYIYTKFFLTPLNVSGLVSIDEPLGLSLKYYITAGGNKIEYPDYILGGENVPLCPPTTSYQPTWGLFNVVHSGNTINNLYTQISRNPFNTSVIFDSDPSTGTHEAPVSDINTTVMVEIIDIDSFGDINASCSNPDSSLSTPIFVPIEFTPLSFQVALTSQPADYYNFAVKNASFRVWYFDDTNGTLIQNWSATTDPSNTNISAISGLYQSTIHTACVLECATDTSTTCFECIKANYAQPICSRDNFSIRPESYAVQVYDINHTASTALKDSTKYSISNQDGFNPGSGQTFERMKLAAGYNYRFDINATGYDGINMTPGYTRIFNGGSDYNATMIWDPQTAGLICNDETDQTLAFYVANGTMINSEQNSSNVGQYKINITDRTWTAVDWLNNTHHSVTNNFETISDCQEGSTTTTVLYNKYYGCTIGTNHGSDNSGDNFYQDHDVEFFPYKFDMNGLTLSYGQDDNTTFDANTFLYMADMAVDDNMSLHINGSVRAVGYNNSTLSNFVNNCYAKPISLTINKSAISGRVAFQSTFNTFNQSGVSNLVSSIPTPWIKDMNSTTGVWQVPIESFDKNMTGSIEITQNLNFDRNQTNAVNPERLTFFTYGANCITPTNCKMNADLNTAYETKGSMDLNQTAPNNNANISITYLYARSHAPTYRFLNPSNDALIYYETFCNGAACDKNLLPNGDDSNTTNDPRWYINTNHTSNYGTAGIVNQKGFAPNAGPVDSTTPNGNHQDFVTLNYDETKGYPYKTTMQMNSSSWLIYNKYNPTTDKNEFTVEYDSSTDSWAGISETNTTTKDDDTTNRTNRRIMW